MIEVYAVKLDKLIEKPKSNELILYLPEEKQDRIKRFYNQKDADRSLIADILIRAIIIRKTGISNKDIVFYNNEWNKPFLKDFNNFHFNISHSGNWVVCAIDDSSVGIDIEKIHLVEDYDIAKRFFSKAEYEALLRKNSSQRMSFFYDLWSIKESYVKWVGKGLSIPLDSFSIYLEDNAIKLITDNQYDICYFKQFNIDADYKMSVCGCNNNFCENLIFENVDDLHRDMY
jgi:4'-phosphopantetheinyl transferase